MSTSPAKPWERAGAGRGSAATLPRPVPRPQAQQQQPQQQQTQGSSPTGTTPTGTSPPQGDVARQPPTRPWDRSGALARRGYGRQGYGATGYGASSSMYGGGYGSTGYGSTGYGSAGYGSTGYGSTGYGGGYGGYGSSYGGGYGGYGNSSSYGGGYGRYGYGAQGGYGQHQQQMGPNGQQMGPNGQQEVGPDGTPLAGPVNAGRSVLHEVSNMVQMFGHVSQLLQGNFEALHHFFGAFFQLTNRLAHFSHELSMIFKTISVFRLLFLLSARVLSLFSSKRKALPAKASPINFDNIYASALK